MAAPADERRRPVAALRIYVAADLRASPSIPVRLAAGFSEPERQRGFFANQTSLALGLGRSAPTQNQLSSFVHKRASGTGSRGRFIMQKLIQGIHEFRERDFRPMEGLFARLS